MNYSNLKDKTLSTENNIKATKPKIIKLKDNFNTISSRHNEEFVLSEKLTNTSHILYIYMGIRNTYLKSSFNITLLRMISNLSKEFHSFIKKADLIKICKLFLLSAIELCYFSLIFRQIISIAELKSDINEMILFSIATMSKFKISNDSTTEYLITYLIELYPNFKEFVSSFSNQLMSHPIDLDFSFALLNNEFNRLHRNKKTNKNYFNHNSLVDELVNSTLPHKKTRLLLKKNKEANETICNISNSLNTQDSQTIILTSPLKKISSDNNNNLLSQLCSNKQDNIHLDFIETDIYKISNCSNHVTYSLSIQDNSNSIKDLYFEKKESTTKLYTLQNEAYNEFDEICTFLSNKRLNLRKQSYDANNEEDSYFI
jgi:hypothetical protein